MSAFVTTERGVLPSGEPFRVARRLLDGWTRAFVVIDGKERRRSMRWLREQKRGEHRREEGE